MHRRPFFLFASLFIPACSPESGPQLVVGMDLTYPPFEYKNQAGEPEGVDVDIAKALSLELGLTLKIESLPFEGLIPALQSGKIDIAISAMTATPERAKSIDFSDPYAQTGICLLVGKNSPVQSGEDLGKPGIVLTAKLATTGETYARQKFPGQKLTVLDDEVSCVREVVQGTADAFIYDQLSIYSHYKRNEATTRALLHPLKQESWAVGIKKGNDTMRLQVNAFLKKFREAKGLEKLGEKYLSEEKKVLESMNIPFILQ